MKTIKQTYIVKSSVEEVWKALVDPKYINGWGGGPAKMDDKAGTKFSLWGGEIFGQNTEVIPNKKLVQDWWDSAGKWDAPSKATFILQEDTAGVKLELIHENVPNESEKDIADGWKQFYLGPLKDYLEAK
jgi:activator of HSP90 ATPase